MDRMEAAVRIVIDLTEAFRRRNIDAIRACLSDDCRIEPFGPERGIREAPGEKAVPAAPVIEGKASAEELCRGLFGRYPDLSLDVEEIFGTGFRCVLRWKCGWNGAALADTAVTGTAITDNTGADVFVRGAGIFKIKNGLVCEALLFRM